MLETRDLTKVYNESVLALNKLNMKVDDGEIYVVLGANGAGKSTTISMLLNFIEPTSGTALIGDIEIPKFPLEAKKTSCLRLRERRTLSQLYGAAKPIFLRETRWTQEGIERRDRCHTWTCRLTRRSLYATRQDILQGDAPTLGHRHCDYEERTSRSAR